MKICLFGASGVLGSEFKNIFEVQKLNFVAPKSKAVSLFNYDKVLAFLKAEKPDLIINCAAYTAVDKAEKEPEICLKLNVGAVETLVAAGIPLINFSTDYVFNAPVGIEIPEDFPRDPQSVYGQSKARGEEILEASHIPWWNIRTSWLWSEGSNNFVSTIKWLSKKYDTLEIIDDQIGRPTYAPELAVFVTEYFVMPSLKILGSSSNSASRSRDQKFEFGHYHLQNQGKPVSWAAFAQYFLNQQGWNGKIRKITSKQYNTLAVRPKNSVLKNTKLSANLSVWEATIKPLTLE